MKKILVLFIASFVGCILCITKTFAQDQATSVTPNGIKYTIHPPKSDKPLIQQEQFLDFHVKIQNYKDSVMMDSYERGPVKGVRVEAPVHPADISEIFTFLSEGDSVTCFLSTDTLKKYGRRELPPFTPAGTYIKYNIKILKAVSKEQMEKEKEQALAGIKAAQTKKIEGYTNTYIKEIMEKKKQAAIAQIRETEMKKMEEYKDKPEKKQKKMQAKIEKVIAQKIAVYESEYADKKPEAPEVKKTESGLHYIITKKTDGKPAVKGKKVWVNYTGKLTDGKVFDSSVEEDAKAGGVYNADRTYEPFSFPLGQGRVIQGWDEGLALLKTGEKATLIIPSYLGYGERGAGQDIPPNAILVFDVELVKVEE